MWLLKVAPDPSLGAHARNALQRSEFRRAARAVSHVHNRWGGVGGRVSLVNEDPFDALGLPPIYNVEGTAIQRAFLARAAAVHPDLVAGDDSERAAAALNKARAILEDPEKRAEVLLTRLGGPGKSEDKSLPAGFLMSILETREAVEQALASKDPAQRTRWEAWAQEQRGEYQRRVASLFAALGDSRDASTLRAVRQELNAWRYIERLIEQLDPDYDPAHRDFAD